MRSIYIIEIDKPLDKLIKRKCLKDHKLLLNPDMFGGVERFGQSGAEAC